MKQFFTQGDIDTVCDERISVGKRYTVVHMANVLEHVLDPKAVLERCCNLLEEGGVLYVDVPNDFNPLQAYLYHGGFIKKAKWIAEMEHISYFSKDSLVRLAKTCGLEEKLILGTDIIEFFGLNPNTNYYDHPEVGRACHAARRHWSKLLRGISMDKKIALDKALGDMGLGRNLIAVFTKG